MPRSRVITPTGELDIASMPAFRRALDDALADGVGNVVVDLSQATFIDSTSLGAVVDTHARLRRQGRSLALVAPRGSAAAVVLTLSQLRRQLNVYDTMRDVPQATPRSQDGTSA